MNWFKRAPYLLNVQGGRKLTFREWLGRLSNKLLTWFFEP